MSEQPIQPLGEAIMTGTSDSILSSLFRNILFDMGVNTSKFNVLLERYMAKSNMTYNIKESSSIRGNLKKELLKSSMSWKVFIKGLVFLNIHRFDITIKLYHKGNVVTEHTRSVALNPEGDEYE